jgi:hypothetical protein
MTPRQDKIVRHIMARAERKFHLGVEWSLTPAEFTGHGASSELLRRSVAQNEVLFASEGLTLLALDHLYTFKSALARYNSVSESCMRNFARSAREDAVDDLRRCVLARGRRAIRKGELRQSYPRLVFRDAALADVNRMYGRAYGSSEKDGGVENDGLTMSPVGEDCTVDIIGVALTCEIPVESEITPSNADKENLEPVPSVGVETETEPAETGETLLKTAVQELPVLPVEEEMRLQADLQAEPAVEQGAKQPTPTDVPRHQEKKRPASFTIDAGVVITPPLMTPRTAKGPPLRLQTSFDAPSVRRTEKIVEVALPSDETDRETWELPIHIEVSCEMDDSDDVLIESDDEEELTARPTGPAGGMPAWSNSMSIDEVLTDGRKRDSDRLGPMTPHDYEDISPITRGEWGFLVADQMARQVAVTTF